MRRKDFVSGTFCDVSIFAEIAEIAANVADILNFTDFANDRPS